MSEENLSKLLDPEILEGVKQKGKYKTYDVPKEWLLDQLKQNKTEREIKAILGTNYETFRRLKKKLGLIEVFAEAAEKRKKTKVYNIKKEVFLNLIEQKKTESQMISVLNLSKEKFDSYIKKYQLTRLMQKLDKERSTESLRDRVAIMIKNGISIKSIAEQLYPETQMKEHQMGYFVRSNMLNSVDLMGTRKRPSKRKGMKLIKKVEVKKENI